MFNWGGAGLEVGDWGGIGGLASPLATAASSVGVPILVAIVIIGALISSAGASGDWVLLQGRMPYSMANNKLFWSPLAEVDKKYRTPVKALIFASILTGITMILLPAFPQVALLASITTLVPYAAAALSLPILRKTDPKTKRPFKLFGGTTFAVLGFVLSTFLVYWASWPWTLIGAGLMLLGYPLFNLVKGERPFEIKRNLWLIAYLAGIIVFSLIGDPTFIYQNFLPIAPLGLLVMPYDLVVLTLFSLGIFAWAYKSNIDYPPLMDDEANE
jgi:amino acid transporter